MAPDDLGDEDLTEVAQDVLLASGWHGAALKNPDRQQAELEEDGYSVFPAARVFLERFGGLHLEWCDVLSNEQTLHTDVHDAIANVFRQNVMIFEERVGHRLCLVGEAFDGYMALLVADDGTVFVGVDDTLRRAGRSPEDALNNILLGFELEDA